MCLPYQGGATVPPNSHSCKYQNHPKKNPHNPIITKMAHLRALQRRWEARGCYSRELKTRESITSIYSKTPLGLLAPSFFFFLSCWSIFLLASTENTCRAHPTGATDQNDRHLTDSMGRISFKFISVVLLQLTFVKEMLIVTHGLVSSIHSSWFKYIQLE